MMKGGMAIGTITMCMVHQLDLGITESNEQFMRPTFLSAKYSKQKTILQP